MALSPFTRIRAQNLRPLDLHTEPPGRKPYALQGVSYLSSEPELSGEVLLHDVIRELDAKVSCGALSGDQLIHQITADRQHFVLALAQLIHQRSASLRVLQATNTQVSQARIKNS